MERFEKIVTGFQLLNIFINRSILDVWQGSEHAPEALLKNFPKSTLHLYFTPVRAEAVARRCSVKKVFLEMSQNS